MVSVHIRSLPRFLGATCALAWFTTSHALSPLHAQSTTNLNNDPALVAFWRFDETQGTQASDATSNSNIVSIAQGGRFTPGVLSPGALELRLKSRALAFPSPTLNAALTEGSWTVAFWMSPAELASTHLFQWGPARLLLRHDASFRLSLRRRTLKTGSDLVLPQDWVHVAVTRTPDTAQLFLNGSNIISGPLPGTASKPTPFRIGGRGKSVKRTFLGQLDDFRIYGRALASAEVQELLVGESPPGVTNRISIAAQDTLGSEFNTDAATVVISRTGGDNALLIRYTVGGTATPGTDYAALPGTVTLPAGASQVTLTVTPVDDATEEPTETVSVALLDSLAYEIVAPSQAEVTLLDDDAPAPPGNIVSIATVQSSATETGPSPAALEIRRTGQTNQLAVPYSFSGSADPASDFLNLAGIAIIPAGATNVIVPITPVDDTLTEGDETVALALGASPAYLLGSSVTGLVTIVDNDAPPGAVRREFWTDAPGDSLDAFPNSNPSGSDVLTNLRFSGNWGENYASRVRGFLVPPTSGVYQFWVAGDDAVEFSLAADDERGNAIRRAHAPAPTGPAAWHTATSQRSFGVELIATNRYYFELRHKDGSGPDHFAVAWTKPGDLESGPTEIIPSSALLPYQPPASLSSGSLYVANLTPIPGADSGGSGSCTIALAADERTARIQIKYTGLSSGLTVAEVRGPAEEGQVGPVLVDLFVPASGDEFDWTIEPSGALSVDDILSAIKSGRVYAIVSTADYPDGEIRGHFRSVLGSQDFTPPPPVPPLASDTPTSVADAVRFLQQATFGATETNVAHLMSVGFNAWFDEQFAAPVTEYTPYLYEVQAAVTNVYSDRAVIRFWDNAVNAPDQLRQRMAWALIQIFVTSRNGAGLENGAYEISHYYDMLLNNAFGNYRDLLEDVSLHPTMGQYLSHRGNAGPRPNNPLRNPDENYAREIMQLFSIGLFRLHPDHTLKLGTDGSPLPTYDLADVVGTAHVFTGYNFRSTNGTPGSFNYPPANWRDSMAHFPDYHSFKEKRLIDNFVLPANQPGPDNFRNTLDILFHHPNTAPFICRQLIQRFVKSNPSPAYIYRVASAFRDNGSGQRGDFKAVLKAILLDPEARGEPKSGAGDGHLREPALVVTQLARLFDYYKPGGYVPQNTANIGYFEAQGQEILGAPSVFNYYEPNYARPGAIAAAGLYSPEFQITTETTLVNRCNLIYNLLTTTGGIRMNLTNEMSLAASPANLVDHLNTYLMANSMSPAMRAELIDALTQIDPGDVARRAQLAAYLILVSPEGNVSR